MVSIEFGVIDFAAGRRQSGDALLTIGSDRGRGIERPRPGAQPGYREHRPDPQFQSRAMKFRQLIQKKDPILGQADLAWGGLTGPAQ
jgi:hypothetical protein